jgi:hypothetical protein
VDVFGDLPITTITHTALLQVFLHAVPLLATPEFREVNLGILTTHEESRICPRETPALFLESNLDLFLLILSIRDRLVDVRDGIGQSTLRLENQGIELRLKIVPEPTVRFSSLGRTREQ